MSETENKVPEKLVARLESYFKSKDVARVTRMGLEHRSLAAKAITCLFEMAKADKIEERIYDIVLKHDGENLSLAISTLGLLANEDAVEHIIKLIEEYPDYTDLGFQQLLSIGSEEAIDALGRYACQKEEVALKAVFDLSAGNEMENYLWISRIGEKYAHQDICVTAFEKLLDIYEDNIYLENDGLDPEKMKEAIKGLRFSILEEESLRELMESQETREDIDNLYNTLKELFKRSGRVAPVLKDPIANLKADLISAADLGAFKLM